MKHADSGCLYVIHKRHQQAAGYPGLGSRVCDGDEDVGGVYVKVRVKN